MAEILFQILIYLGAAVIAVPLAARLGLGSVLGYLAAGIAIGPILGLVGSETKDVQHVAEFGIVMMLFLIGLSLDPRALWDMRHRLLGLGGAAIGADHRRGHAGCHRLGISRSHRIGHRADPCTILDRNCATNAVRTRLDQKPWWALYLCRLINLRYCRHPNSGAAAAFDCPAAAFSTRRIPRYTARADGNHTARPKR